MVLGDEVFHPATVTGPPMFFKFLMSDTGAAALTTVEHMFEADVEMKAGQEFLVVRPHSAAPDVDRELKKMWHDRDFEKALRLRMYDQLSAYSWKATLPTPHAALVAFHKAAILREADLVGILVEETGEIAVFGSMEAVTSARAIIDSMLTTHFPQRRSYVRSFSGCEDQFSPRPRALSDLDPLVESVSSDLLCASDVFFDGRRDSSSTLDLFGAGAEKRKERIMFMVRSSDAPKLIGSRGVNKKRIEEFTDCSIILHTESKKDGEFPVEVVGSSHMLCEAARNHIETFLSESMREEEDKQRGVRERPKVHLAMSPRKQLKRNS